MIEEEKQEIRRTNEIIKALEFDFFSLVVHSENEISLIDFGVEKENDKFYGIEIDLETLEFNDNNYQKIIDEDLNRIKSILLTLSP